MKVDRSTGRLRHTAKREVAKVKACSELCVMLDTKEGGKKLINWLDRSSWKGNARESLRIEMEIY